MRQKGCGHPPWWSSWLAFTRLSTSLGSWLMEKATELAMMRASKAKKMGLNLADRCVCWLNPPRVKMQLLHMMNVLPETLPPSP